MTKTSKNAPPPKPDHADAADSSLVPMLIAGLVFVVIGYVVIMLFV